MKLRIWHFVTPTPTEWQQDKPADDNGTAEYFLDGCVAAHRTANNGWQTSPTRTPQRIWFLENIAGGPPEDVDGAWVRCYFDPQSGRWVALGNPNGAPQNQNPDPEDPSNNDDCCRYGQLFICPLPEGIQRAILCSAVDPPIDGEKMWKVRFFNTSVDTGGDTVTEEHTEILTLPCTEETCKRLDLSSVSLGGVDVGVVTYGNYDGCCVESGASNHLTLPKNAEDTNVWVTTDGIDVAAPSEPDILPRPIIVNGNDVKFQGDLTLGSIEIRNNVMFRSETQIATFSFNIDRVIVVNPMNPHGYPPPSIEFSGFPGSAILGLLHGSEYLIGGSNLSTGLPTGVFYNPGDFVEMRLEGTTEVTLLVNGNVVGTASTSLVLPCTAVGCRIAVTNITQVIDEPDLLLSQSLLGCVEISNVSASITNAPDP